MATTTKKSSTSSAKETQSSTVKNAAKSASISLQKKPKGNTGKMQDSEFHQFFVDELKDIYWAEKHLVKALPKMKKAATSKELAAAFEKHTEETNTHIQTLEKVFELLDEKAQAKKCDAMAGLLEEADSIIADTDQGTLVRDAGLILAAQKVEHYEIATYGTLRTFAENMGHTDVVELLQGTLDDEKATDEALTGIAESFVNEQAAQE
ncbi:Ferritin-like metal-binding protein YciE [Pedobacter antarcticus]|uniref:Ferritin-like metal-binding protein YciE n=2 Tax=Pedobacter antarcticus TaxID=34086 RepID=A0A1I2BBM1_9SPHI|nr:ferritin-like domain-containing protein [Pedobacter antarcticus]SFE53377.1 Ferritin-like metal-binding protein YciE [Pedobacter antarcticus]